MNEVFNIVYLGRMPIAFSSDGLNVLLCDLIKALRLNDVQCVIHTTKRHKLAIQNALLDNGILANDVQIKAYWVDSLLLRTVKKERRKKSPLLSRLLESFFDTILSSFAKLICYSLDFTWYTVCYKLILILMLAIISVIASISSIFFILILFVSRLIGKLIDGIYRRLVNSAINYIKSHDKLKYYAKSFILYGKTKIIRKIANRLYDMEQRRFAAVLSKRCEKAFFFNCFDGTTIASFKGKSLVVFPDSVSLLYPERYIEYHDRMVAEGFQKALNNSTTIVCYSEFVRSKQLKYFLSSDQILAKSVVIPQGSFDLADQDESDDINPDLVCGYSFNYFPSLLSSDRKINFDQFKYIIYPTVDRPHKNLITVLRSFERLLRRHYLNVKLVLTTPSLSKEVYDFIHNNRLYYDIIFFPSVPLDILDWLIKNSALVIHSSVAEGGDVFNFTRAASFGVPSLLSNVPVVREMFDRRGVGEEMYKDFLFPVSDYIKLTDMSLEAFSNDELIKKQSVILNSLSVYSYSDMAKLYYSEYKAM